MKSQYLFFSIALLLLTPFYSVMGKKTNYPALNTPTSYIILDGGRFKNEKIEFTPVTGEKYNRWNAKSKCTCFYLTGKSSNLNLLMELRIPGQKDNYSIEQGVASQMGNHRSISNNKQWDDFKLVLQSSDNSFTSAPETIRVEVIRFENVKGAIELTVTGILKSGNDHIKITAQIVVTREEDSKL